MTMQAAVNLDTYNLSLLTAKEDILNPRSSTNWALFTYEGISNKLKLADSGAGGVAEMAGKFHIAKPQYGLCRVGTVETGGPCIAMISWMGQQVDDYRRTECSGHTTAIKNFFKESHVFINAEKVDEVTEEVIAGEHSKVQARAPMERVRRSTRSAEKEETVGTNYRKTNAAMEMRRINRDSFWARAEREEEQRKEEERKRVVEDRRRLERERVQNELKEADERDRKMNEKLHMIEEQRKKKAEKEEELRGREKSRWVQQQRDHEDDMRARLNRSESIEMAAEAAVLVSQRSVNPREFFRQLSSQSPTSPRTGKPPLRRYQRSLTDTAFIFNKAPPDSGCSSPRSPPFVSPFSRGSASSPFFRATMSPPTSPDFRPVPSPKRPPAPAMSPPPSPPVFLPTGIAYQNHHQHRRPRRHSDMSEDPATSAPTSPPPLRPSAPPASLLASCPPPLEEDADGSGAVTLPPSPPMTPPGSQALRYQPLSPDTPPQTRAHRSSRDQAEVDPVPQAPTALLPINPQPSKDLHAASTVHTELDSAYIAQAVLVEEEEEEEEQEEEKKDEAKKGEDEPTPQPQPSTAVAPLLQTGEERTEPEPEAALGAPVAMEQEEEEERGAGGEDHGPEGDQPDGTVLFSEEPIAAISSKEERERGVADTEQNVCEQITHTTVMVSTNGFTNGDAVQENGIERSLSPSDTELSSPELAVCYQHEAVKREYIEVDKDEEEQEEEEQQEKEEEVEEEEEEVEIFENGQEDSMERQMCVRALYDYQAEDESEISFEPGDVISNVEMVDKAWWRGCSKDGRQGLFPANYVETI